ncbi:flagellar motor switch phosphatase FliY [Metabacillus sp. GX 13764]|uniref:flagellar motor switch phosphatase FliY n=1 Tax=Metabacillus kandeliae TaxID=2900151 RepID=UPI001E5F0017|nr:flagellar motor switch phosphatase FliY [Metabacillus kandeliae]MCD7033771.1 flagellar motor switch phosphatase FliY [Metabacillus kandeliae]
MVSNEMLSQDEIDALLKGTSYEPETADSALNEYLDEMEQDAIGEIGNISFGSSATALSTLLNQKVEITTPTVSIVSKKDLSDEFPHPYVAIEVTYTEGFTGSNMLVIQQSDAAIIADLMIGGDGRNPDPGLGEIQLSAVQEAMNQMMGSAATSMSTVFNKRVDISPPRLELLDVKEGEGTESLEQEDLIIKVSFQLKVGDLIDSNIMQLLPVKFAKALIDELMNPKQEAAAAEAQVLEQKNDPPAYEEKAHFSEPMNQEPAYREEPPRKAQPPVDVKPAEFVSFEHNEYHAKEPNNLDMLMDIPLQVTVELGRTKRSVKEILELSAGSIIELDKLAGEPVDILINRKIVAKGEVVVIDENFGVRVTDIISQRDRLTKIK